MPLYVNDTKVACAACIRGHRTSACVHSNRELFEVRRKGRPKTQCVHCSKQRLERNIHVKCTCGAAQAADMDSTADVVESAQNWIASALLMSPSGKSPPTSPSDSTVHGAPKHSCGVGCRCADDCRCRSDFLKVANILNPCSCNDGGVCRCCTNDVDSFYAQNGTASASTAPIQTLDSKKSGGCCEGQNTANGVPFRKSLSTPLVSHSADAGAAAPLPILYPPPVRPVDIHVSNMQPQSPPVPQGMSQFAFQAYPPQCAQRVPPHMPPEAHFPDANFGLTPIQHSSVSYPPPLSPGTGFYCPYALPPPGSPSEGHYPYLPPGAPPVQCSLPAPEHSPPFVPVPSHVHPTATNACCGAICTCSVFRMVIGEPSCHMGEECRCDEEDGTACNGCHA